jgi:CubicO group peptidase (beta-lactamase class C family)
MSLAERMEHYKTPGVSIAYFRDGKLEWAQGFGTLAGDGEKMVRPTTAFQAASITKAFTAITVLALVEEGKLELDSEITRYLGDWTAPTNPYPPHRAPTLRQVLAHLAGFSVSGFTGYKQGQILPTVDQILDGEPPANSPKLEIIHEPGTRALYSGGGYVVLQKIIETVTGEKFEDVVRERILEPLSMSKSGFFMSAPEKMGGDFAYGHDSNGNAYPGGFITYPESAPAGLWSTPSDLAMLAIEVQDELAGRSSRILSAKVVREMLTRQIGNWALGWEFFDAEEPARSFYASGSNRGYKSILYVRRDGSEGVAIMTNSDNGGGLFGEILAGMAITHDWSELKPGERKTASLSAEELGALAGVYTFSAPLAGTLVVKAGRDAVTIEVPGLAAETAFYPTHDEADVFFSLTGDLASFGRNASGAPATVQVGDVTGKRN